MNYTTSEYVLHNVENIHQPYIYIFENFIYENQTLVNLSSRNDSSSNNINDLNNYTNNDLTLFKQLANLKREHILLICLLFLFSFATVFGNMLVILAVIREHYLHTATNYFITSLAVADCLVGLVVMPFSALYEILEHTWFFGINWCDIWRSLDVLFSTASILNLCVISLDRYWAITDPFSYPTRMSRKCAVLLITIVWICSSAISFPAILWWRAVRGPNDVPKFKCPFTDHTGYLIFSSLISFYLPLFVMVFTYYKIYRAAIVQMSSLKLGTKQVMMGCGELELTLRIHRGGTSSSRTIRNKSISSSHIESSTIHTVDSDDTCFRHKSSSGSDVELLTTYNQQPNTKLLRIKSPRILTNTHGKNFSLSRKLSKLAKEKKAAKTLGIVMGVFIICWLPFFVVNLLSGLCVKCIYHEQLVLALVTWLGWINSSMNPVIYACWSRDFRKAFLRILCMCCFTRVRKKYQLTIRCKRRQRIQAQHYYSTYSARQNSF